MQRNEVIGQQEVWNRLMEMVQENRLPHALMFCGPQGCGKLAMALAANYYNTNSARAAFYPQITLSGSGGWTNNSGAGIVNPGQLLASAIGSLTQPLFYRGANIARLKQAKAQEDLYHQEGIDEETRKILSIQTYYESMWIERGLNIKYQKFKPRSIHILS